MVTSRNILHVSASRCDTKIGVTGAVGVLQFESVIKYFTNRTAGGKFHMNKYDTSRQQIFRLWETARFYACRFQSIDSSKAPSKLLQHSAPKTTQKHSTTQHNTNKTHNVHHIPSRSRALMVCNYQFDWTFCRFFSLLPNVVCLRPH